MLTTEQILQYENDGYVLPDFRLSQDSIEAIREDHGRLIEKYPEFTDYCGALLVYDIGFLNYARNDDLLDLVEQLIGSNIALWNSSLFAKPARIGTRTPWHQDGEYWPIRPLATCSVWIAVDDSNCDNGCLRVIPGSHKSRTLSKHNVNNAHGLALNLELDGNEFDETKAVDIELEAGQISMHDVFLMHASEPNNSDMHRRGMTLRFMPTTSVYRRDIGVGATLRINQQRTLFLMRGRDVSGQNDFRVR